MIKIPARNGMSDRNWAEVIDRYMMSLGNSKIECAARAIVRQILYLLDVTQKTKLVSMDAVMKGVQAGINDPI